MAFLVVRSKNHTANGLRRKIEVGKKNVLFRLGSMTPTADVKFKFPNRPFMEINTVEACKLSGNKLEMKKRFIDAGVKTAPYYLLSDLPGDYNTFPSIIKHLHSSKGEGIYYIENKEQLDDFLQKNAGKLDRHIIEKYYTFSKEYRIHVTKDGCFYTCRKMLKQDAEVRWHRHDNNSVWILEENELFAKPQNWDEIVAECVKAMESVGLDICAVDLKCQTKMDGPVDFIILETNSAPSLGEITTVKYIEKLTEMTNGIIGG